MSAEGTTPAPDPRRWLTLIAMTGTLSMVLLDQTVVSVALPTIQRDLDMSQTELQWIVNAYLLSLAVLVAVGGRLSDMFNRVRMLILGIVIFVVASALCGIAQTDWWILSARALEGVGAALMIPPSGALVINAFRVEERGRAMGIYAGVSMIFLSLGPLVGGFFTDYVDWRWVFYVNLPVGIATILMTLRAKPDGRVLPGQRMDWLGAALLIPGLSSIVLALMQSSEWGWGAPQTVILLVGGTLLVIGFCFAELRVRQPLVELRLFKGRNFSADSFVLFCVQFALLGLTVFGAIYIQDVIGYSPMGAGLALLPLTIPLLVMAPVAGRLYDRLGPRGIVSLGCLLITISFAYGSQILDQYDYWLLVPCYVLNGIGIALIMSPANTDAMNAAARDLRGQASGVIQTVRQIGGTVGLAIVGTIVANVQSSSLDEKLVDTGASASQIDSIQRVLAEDPTTRAQTAASLPSTEVSQVTAIARAAISDGITASYYASGAIMLLAGLVALLALRKMTYTDDEPAPHPSVPHPLGGPRPSAGAASAA